MSTRKKFPVTLEVDYSPYLEAPIGLTAGPGKVKPHPKPDWNAGGTSAKAGLGPERRTVTRAGNESERPQGQRISRSDAAVGSVGPVHAPTGLEFRRCRKPRASVDSGMGRVCRGLHNRGQPTRFLNRLSHLIPNLGIAAVIWAFQQPEPLAFWVAASVYFASVQWLSKRQLDLFSFILGWLSLWGLTIGGRFQASVWNCMPVYTCCALLTVAVLRLASGVEGRQLKQKAGTSSARCLS